MSDIALNSDWDIAFIDGDLSEVSGGQLTRQNSKFRLQIIAGELFEDTRAGVPWLSDMVDPRVSMDAKKAILRANIVKSFGCISVDSLSVVVEDDIARVDFAGTCASGQFEDSLVIYSEGLQANALPSFGTDARIINLPVITETYSTSFAMYGSQPVLCIVDELSTGTSCEIVTLGNLVVYTSDGRLLASGNGAVTLDPLQTYDNLYVYIYQPFPQPQQTVTLSFVIVSPAQAVIAAMDNEPDNTRKALITTTVQDLLDNGIWQKADVICFRAAADLQASLLDWKRLIDGALPDAGTLGGLTVDSGIVIDYDGGGYGIFTGYSPQNNAINYALDNACIASYVVNTSGDALIFESYHNSEPYNSFLQFGSDGYYSLFMNSSGYLGGNDAPGNYDGFWIAQRQSGTAYIYRDGTLLDSGVIAADGLPESDISQGPSTASYTGSAEHVFFYAGAALSNAQRAALQTIVTNYLAGL